MNKCVKAGIVFLVIIHFSVGLSYSGTNVFQIPKAPENGSVSVYYTIDLPAEWVPKLTFVDETRKITNAAPFLAAQGVALERDEFAYYFPAMRCLIVGASAATQDRLVFLFD